MKRALAGLLLLLSCAACEQKQKAMENLAHDQEVMKAASAAANEVVRNATASRNSARRSTRCGRGERRKRPPRRAPRSRQGRGGKASEAWPKA
jgi:hypothetical protein